MIDGSPRRTRSTFPFPSGVRPSGWLPTVLDTPSPDDAVSSALWDIAPAIVPWSPTSCSSYRAHCPYIDSPRTRRAVPSQLGAAIVLVDLALISQSHAPTPVRHGQWLATGFQKTTRVQHRFSEAMQPAPEGVIRSFEKASTE